MTKTTILTMLLGAGTAVAGEVPTPTVPMRERVRHEDLAKRFVREEQRIAERAVARPAKPVDKRDADWKPVSLLARSEFLSFNGLSTLVPKGALLHVPAAYRNRTRLVEGTRIVRWPEFLRNNRNWVTTFEVTRELAEAEEAFDEESVERIEKNSNVVVATISGGPVGVLREAPAAAGDGKTETTNQKEQ